jgi:hypothetical protein
MSPSPVLVLPRRSTMTGPVASALLAAIALASCASGAGQAAPASEVTITAAPSTEMGTLPPSTTAPAGTLSDAVLATIVADAAAATGVDPATVTVVSAKPVTWMDGSLGCPKPGVMYTQSVVPGFRVIVRAGDQKFDYRVGRGGTAKRCDSGMSVGSDG